MALIESGSLTPGVNAADFGLLPYTALRIELPDRALRPYLADYHVLDSEGPAAEAAVNWPLPGWPAIRIILADRPIRLEIGNRYYDPLPVASLYGTTTRAMRMVSNGGVTIGVSIGPLGWSRLFKAPAERFRDRIVPLEEAMAPALVADLVRRLDASDRAREVKPILDRFFLHHMAPPCADEPVIAAIARLIADDSTTELTNAATALGIGAGTLRRLSTRYFGFPPKTLLMRARLLRTIAPMLASRTVDYPAALDRYHDVPHFLRDAKRFLTMTPRQFLAIDQPYLYAIMRARRLVMEADRAQRVGTGSSPA